MALTGSRGFATPMGIVAGVVAMAAVTVGSTVFTHPLPESLEDLYSNVQRPAEVEAIELVQSQQVQPDEAQPEDAQPEDADRPAQPDMGQLLIAGLRKSPGCIGVDAGQMQSGKNTIFAWFKNKEAVVEWYYSREHMGIIDNLIPGDVDHEPLSFVEDEQTPIMVIATITFADRPHFEGIRLPISQISIELFAPLPGGAHLGGRLAPKEFKVEHMENLEEDHEDGH